ncbi:MAG: outer membrane protein assembly factor BamB [Sterolibacterium sp.]|nr:outer membrane protein assembly factor BamB [Sterolibacterium sp.]
MKSGNSVKLGLCCTLAAASVLLTSCASWNPFASKPKYKPAELTTLTATADIRSEWQANVGSSGEYTFTPLVVGNTVYAAARDGTLARYDNGQQVWRIRADQAISAGVGGNGKVVAVGSPKGAVLVFDAANGQLLWKAQVSSEVLAAPAVNEQLVVVRSGDARIFAFDATTGKRLWVYQRSTPTLSLRTPVGVVLAGGRGILAGFPGGKLLLLNPANGAPMWESTVAIPKGTTELERIADLTSAPVVFGNSVCAAAFQGRVACFDLGNGNLSWSRDISSISGLAADLKGVYVSDENGQVQAYDRSNGASLWKQDKLRYRGLSRPVIVGRHVAVGDKFGVVHVMRPDNGEFVARFTTDGSALAADPQNYRDGFVVQTRNGLLHALFVK